MLDLVVAVNDKTVLERNLLRSPVLNLPGVSLLLREGYESAGRAYQSALAQGKNEWVVFVHQDVFIPEGWERKLLHAIRSLESVDRAWAVIGLYGVTSNGDHVGHLWCSHCNTVLGTHFSAPKPVFSIDELLIVVKRSSGVAFDEELPGYHLYGTDIVQCALQRGRGAYVACAPVIHNARPIPYLDSAFFSAYRYLVEKWGNKLPIHTPVTTICDSKLLYLRMRTANLARRIRQRNVDRRSLDRGYDPVVLAKRLGFF